MTRIKIYLPILNKKENQEKMMARIQKSLKQEKMKKMQKKIRRSKGLKLH
jgi:hypothetical protein